MGVFFVGAYQETLGDLHNLFGDTNVVTIELREDGAFDLLHEQEGDTIAEVLSYVEYDPRDMVDAFRKMVDFYLQDKLDLQGLITRRYPIDRINEAFDDLLAGGVGRGIIDFSQ